MEIRSPIFIIGSSRSGKSLLRNLLAVHKETCWFSNYSDRLYRLAFAPLLNRLVELPVLKHRARKAILDARSLRFVPRPAEGDRIYHRFCGIQQFDPHRSHPIGYLQRQRLQTAISRHLRFQGKPRFINDKSENSPRAGDLSVIFPSALFIHVVRDGRAVANEIRQTSWWTDKRLWWCGITPREWQKSGGDPIVLSGRHWQNNVRKILESTPVLGKHYLEVRYEELTNDPRECISRVLSFCRLEEYRDYLDLIPQEIMNCNYRWKNELHSDEVAAVEKEIRETQKLLGYQ
jgi:hypothetical protein